MVFRDYFLTFWLILNGIFAWYVELVATPAATPGEKVVKLSEQSGVLQKYALFCAAICIFRVGFGALHIAKFKILAMEVTKLSTSIPEATTIETISG